MFASTNGWFYDPAHVVQSIVSCHQVTTGANRSAWITVNEVAALIVAVVAASVTLVLIVLSSFESWRGLSAFGSVLGPVSAVTFAVATVIGFPAYLVVRQFLRVRWPIGLALGFAVGFLPVLIALLFEMHSISGTQLSSCNLILLINRCTSWSVLLEAAVAGISGAVGGLVFSALASSASANRGFGS